MNQRHSKDRQVQPMPFACRTDESGNRYWVGADVILDKLADPDYKGNLPAGQAGFELRSEVICRQLYSDRGHITGALIGHLPTKTTEEIRAKIIITACDVLRPPQLLWASGIRPKALGHYLNEHPFIFCFAELNDDLVKNFGYETCLPVGKVSDFGEIPKSQIRIPKSKDPTIGVFWVPFDAPNHPFHGQIMHMNLSPIKIDTKANAKHIVGLGWGCVKELRFEDHIEFLETENDWLGHAKNKSAVYTCRKG